MCCRGRGDFRTSLKTTPKDGPLRSPCAAQVVDLSEGSHNFCCVLNWEIRSSVVLQADVLVACKSCMGSPVIYTTTVPGDEPQSRGLNSAGVIRQLLSSPFLPQTYPTLFGPCLKIGLNVQINIHFEQLTFRF